MKSSFVSRLLRRLPSRCPLCQMAAHGGLLCAGCEADTFGARQRRSLCRTCGVCATQSGLCSNCEHGSVLDAVVCAIDYQFSGQLLIQLYKEGKQLTLARLLSDLMVRAAQPLLQTYQLDAWVPIPASAARLKHTGFSPAQQLARLVASATNIPCRLDWLTQRHDGPAQKTLNRRERSLSVRGRYVAHPAVAGRPIGVIDDVVTTTSTAVEVARVAKAAGARQVVVLAAARTPQRA
ncbi:ComF family protein [Orrella daihaiensis]|uniref:ComF family protein n=1 Tax=Orrella daihaiensis TaxID=2782176 RepID=A0ABY4AK41_9BURK|nr:ComF family protein [Orrella daihaiensis]UOD50640.1 ComF family protein [Orrella daihaiensis]